MEKSTAPFENSREIEELSSILSSDPELELAVLVGSRAEGTARPESDWDLAIQWQGPDAVHALYGAHRTAAASSGRSVRLLG